MKRRTFISLLSGAAVWPVASHAQQSTMPVIGFLSSQYPEGYGEPLRGFRRGLKDAGYVEGENVAIDFRWAGNQTDRLLPLAVDLAGRQVALIVRWIPPPRWP